MGRRSAPPNMMGMNDDNPRQLLNILNGMASRHAPDERIKAQLRAATER